MTSDAENAGFVTGTLVSFVPMLGAVLLAAVGVQGDWPVVVEYAYRAVLALAVVNLAVTPAAWALHRRRKSGLVRPFAEWKHQAPQVRLLILALLIVTWLSSMAVVVFLQAPLRPPLLSLQTRLLLSALLLVGMPMIALAATVLRAGKPG